MATVATSKACAAVKPVGRGQNAMSRSQNAKSSIAITKDCALQESVSAEPVTRVTTAKKVMVAFRKKSYFKIAQSIKKLHRMQSFSYTIENRVHK